MEKKVKEEGNKLIALFDGAYFVNDDVEAYPNGYMYFEDIGAMEFENLLYSECWNWLIPIIEQISKMPIKNAEHRQDTYYPRTFGMLNEETGNPMFRFYCCPVFEAPTLFEAAWLAVVDFVKTELSLAVEGGGFKNKNLDSAKRDEKEEHPVALSALLAVTDGIQNINESPGVAVCEHELWIPYKGAMVQCKKCGKNQFECSQTDR